jgi:UDP-N-acetylglucosamine 2-epimerase (non-hydrolysing)
MEKIGYVNNNPLVKFCKPFGFIEYNHLQLNAFCVISDSGTIAEESSILKIPAITIRQAHERPEGMDEGILIMAGLKKDRIIEAINIIRNQIDNGVIINSVQDYTSLNVSNKVLRIILSYTDYINRTVWKKL